MWSNDPKQLSVWLRKAADEMRTEDHNGWPVLCDTVADYLSAAPSPSPAPGVVAWMRKWAFDGIDVMAMPKKDRPAGWMLHEVTRHQCLPDDVPLASLSQPAKEREGEQP